MHNAGQRITNVLGRVLFTTFAVLSSVAFGACAIMLVVFVRPVGWPKILLQGILIECFAVASLFMLLAAISFIFESAWLIHRLERLTPKAALIVIGFALLICLRATWEMIAG